MNTEAMFSSKTDLWATPKDFFDQLDAEFGFTLDACALPENAKCKTYYTPEQDGLAQPWEGVVWCNLPTVGRSGSGSRRLTTRPRGGGLVVMLLPARTDTKWFHDYIYQQTEIRFVKGRLKFGDSKNAAPFPSMVCVFNGGVTDED